MRTLRWALAVTSLVPLLTGAAPLDARLETSRGSSVQLSALWKKPTVLFYEDKDSTALNQHVKDALFTRGRERGMLDKVAVIPVASVSRFDWPPARGFVLSAVQDTERKMKVAVYLDFKGALAAPPWNLPARNSTVMVLDARGNRVLTYSGALTTAQVESLFSTLESMI